ncbi:MAG TPA: hypothetical protein PKA28_19115 [Methylomusa anaerophila]|uniref:Uncharacterized protein n=1 Tax=Methylomusa anaerophila TaxID=1930071 RepID=A0A348AIA0_9FIRM|nr:hypothetical protein [Methylomusa anaerophila]BBB90798.1 hypothetical protein MAMMFC1_01459 [Methylomusa anaerophila]HML90545.1 hypothetical protein [Methylomusa anaerophila]
MTERTLVDWINWYEKKTGEKFVEKPGFNIEFHPDKGFMQWKQYGKTFLIGQIASADNEYWAEFVKRKGKELGCKVARTLIPRKSPGNNH